MDRLSRGAGSSSPHPSGWRDDRGMATAELAVGVLSLLLVTAVGVGLVMVAVGHVRVADAARSAARMLARGEPESEVGLRVRAALPASQLLVRRGPGEVEVRVVAVLTVPGPLPEIAVTGRSVAPAELVGPDTRP